MRLNTIVVFLLGLVIEVMMPVDGSNAILVDTDEIPIELTAGEALGCVMKRKPIPGRARYPDRGFEIRMKTTTDGGLVLFEFTDFTKKLLIYKM
ncbi:hypothetical protein Pmar_PMAR010674 [Perkinsus marinus ATCC 50983]|uniref:Uncharacterized protein n=1 Tax=Perkinsus marinus (strain ATCC 50983 / TXsc) TaxID=423536 RepID=C5KW06_PERM5|nr:hypothetical protein Pmar_PMAR010674 [Perkinsus marinus ATCC 50983]EER11337.1 hypothetical protein Pmar_PMAR010674 [Perkinsus marinus ATCC 50983]|eukprot:XP_002779542.1 hypothetical protein Pmar_PMAR010674 [Perkinsus marinus ATCC 50983]